jgi:hypothetical protein
MELPSAPKSHKDIELPKRTDEKIENPEPIRPTERSDKLDPNHSAPSRDKELPQRKVALTDIVEPSRASPRKLRQDPKAE